MPMLRNLPPLYLPVFARRVATMFLVFIQGLNLPSVFSNNNTLPRCVCQSTFIYKTKNPSQMGSQGALHNDRENQLIPLSLT